MRSDWYRNRAERNVESFLVTWLDMEEIERQCERRVTPVSPLDLYKQVMHTGYPLLVLLLRFLLMQCSECRHYPLVAVRQ